MTARAAISEGLSPQYQPLARPRSLDDLAALRAPQLLELYRAGAAPPVSELHGDLRGRMLAIQGAGRLLFALLRAFAAWQHFPWRGKSFAPRTEGTRGDGINRVFGDVQPLRWFRFETFIAPSRADGGPAFQLDYDNPDNPFFIRAIKDELRRVGPGMFLGQAYLMLWGKPRLALYFALSVEASS